MAHCVFCEVEGNRVVLRNDLALALWDAFPVTPMHALVVPNRHAADYFSLTREELLACDDLLRQARALLRSLDPTIQGFNIGVNAGTVAGQTISHCHFHLIPRRDGDVENPRGGVRNIFPGKGDY